MRIFSAFDGISCGQVALKRLGITPSIYYASEVDKYAITVTQKNHPDTVQVGDIRRFFGDKYDDIDLLLGGSPCQDLSAAGKGAGLGGARSSLFYDFLRLKQQMKPKYFLLENVASMSKENCDEMTRLMGVEPIMINSALVSAQNRKRLYWTNIKNIQQPDDKNIMWRDITVDTPTDKQAVAAIRRRYLVAGKRQTAQFIEFRHDGKSNALTTVKKDNVVVPFALPNKVLANDFCFRPMNIVEYERLQTLPDHYTAGIPNSHRYRSIGNGWTVDVIAHILKNIGL